MDDLEVVRDELRVPVLVNVVSVSPNDVDVSVVCVVKAVSTSMLVTDEVVSVVVVADLWGIAWTAVRASKTPTRGRDIMERNMFIRPKTASIER